MEDSQSFEEYIRWVRTGDHGMKPAAGGYLVPEYIECNLPGRRAAFMRFLGRLARNAVIYSKGTEMRPFAAILRDTLDELIVNRTDEDFERLMRGEGVGEPIGILSAEDDRYARNGNR